MLWSPSHIQTAKSNQMLISHLRGLPTLSIPWNSWFLACISANTPYYLTCFFALFVYFLYANVFFAPTTCYSCASLYSNWSSPFMLFSFYIKLFSFIPDIYKSCLLLSLMSCCPWPLHHRGCLCWGVPCHDCLPSLDCVIVKNWGQLTDKLRSPRYRRQLYYLTAVHVRRRH